MSYVDDQKIEQLIAVARSCGLNIDEKRLRELAGYSGDPHEADDQIGLLLADGNRSAHYDHSVAYMAEYEQTFFDLMQAALKMLGIDGAQSKYEYVDNPQSDDIEIRIGDDVYKYNFRYGYTSDAELLGEVSKIAATHSDSRIVEIHGPDESYVLFVPLLMAEFLDETFLYMKML